MAQLAQPAVVVTADIGAPRSGARLLVAAPGALTCGPAVAVRCAMSARGLARRAPLMRGRAMLRAARGFAACDVAPAVLTVVRHMASWPVSCAADRARLESVPVGLSCGAVGGLFKASMDTYHVRAVQASASGPGRYGGAVIVRSAAKASVTVVESVAACGRKPFLLADWAQLPPAWLEVEVEASGFVGRSLAALDILRGASVARSDDDGAILIGGNAVVGDDGRLLTVPSLAEAQEWAAGSTEALALLVGYAVGYVGAQRSAKLDASRKATRVVVAKVGERINAGLLGRGQARALQADLDWRQMRL